MKYLKLFENFNLDIGDDTEIGKIQDVTDTQYQINGNWYAKKIVKKGVSKPPEKQQIKNRGEISPNMVVSAYANPLEYNKVKEYEDIFNADYLQHEFPPIEGFPFIIDEYDIGNVFMCGEYISNKYIGKYAWKVTDGHHRTMAAINTNIPYLETKLQYAYLGDETDYIPHEIDKN